MEENKKVYRPKRPKIKLNGNASSQDYYVSMTEESINSDSRKNLELNRDMIMNDDINKKERKKSVQTKRNLKKSFTELQKKLKKLITKIDSPSYKIKCIFHKWVYLTFNQKNNINDNEEEEEEEEIEKEENNKDNLQVYKMRKINNFSVDNENKKNNIDAEEEEEEEEEEEDDEELMNNLNLINLEEIEERPPNEEESAMTSVATKSKNQKNQLNVALRKIFKYKNFFYYYFTKWKKVTSNPEIMIILKLQKKLKNLIMRLDGKRNLLKLAMAFKDWKMKCEQLRLSEKKVKKKKKIIIYKKKNGEMEIKENIEDFENLNDIEDNLNIIKDGVKIKKIKKKKIFKKKINSSKPKKTKNESNTDNNTENINITPIKENNSSQDNIINIIKKENEKSEVNSNNISDIKNENESNENNDKNKKVVKKVKKIVKKFKKGKEEKIEKSENNIKQENTKNKSRNKIDIEKNDFPSLFISSDQIKTLKPSNNIEKTNDNNNYEKEELISSSATKIKLKKKMKKLNKLSKDDINNKSSDVLFEQENRLKAKNLFKVFSNSYNPNSETLNIDNNDEINKSRDKSVKTKRISKKKKTQKSKIKEKKSNNDIENNEDNKEYSDDTSNNNENNELIINKPYHSSRERVYKIEKVEDNKNNDIINIEKEKIENLKKFPSSKIQFKTDMNEDSQKKLVSSLFHNSSKDSNLDLKAINSHDLIDFSEVTSDDDVKKIKNKSKKNKNNEKQNYKDEINPDIINIEITQDDDDSEERKKNIKKKKNKNDRVYTKEEKKLIKIYKKAFHHLRRVIRSFKKRKKLNTEGLDIYFNKWRNNFKNKLTNKNNDIENILGEKIEFINEEKEENENLEKYKDINNKVHNHNKNNKEKEVYNNINKNRFEEKEDEKEDKKDNKINNNGNMIISDKDEDNNNIINNDISQKIDNKNNNKDNIESQKNNLLYKLFDLVKSNYKTQNDTIDIIKRTDEKIFNKINIEKYINFLENNNKRISAYQIFYLFANYRENINYCMKNNNPKRFYFNLWNKNINK